MAYFPEPPPENTDLAGLTEYVYRQLRIIGEALDNVDSIILKKLYVEPTTKKDGQLEYADGTTWNPGAGEGVYQWNGTTWEFLG